MENASEYLIDCVDENGKFIYRYNPLDDNTTNTYNILRHEGTVWSMLEVYKITKNKELKENIELATKFVVNKSVKDKDENTSYIIENKNNEIKLGANGIGILMFIEYMETFNTDEYKEVIGDLRVVLKQITDAYNVHFVYDGYNDFDIGYALFSLNAMEFNDYLISLVAKKYHAYLVTHDRDIVDSCKDIAIVTALT